MDTFHDLIVQLLAPFGAGWILYRWLGDKLKAHQDVLAAARMTDLNLAKRDRLDGDGRKVKVVSDPRLGKLGQRSIWCDHPGARCSCMTCRWNRKYGEPKPVVAPPAPIYASGPSHPVKPLVAPPPPTNCKLCFRTRPGPVICSREEFDEHQRHA